MTKVEGKDKVKSFGIYGKLGQAYEYGNKIYGANYYGNEETSDEQSEYGLKNYGNFEYGSDSKMWGIYQRRHGKGKTVYTKLKFYIPKNPRTVSQQNNRTKFINGMTAWANLTENQKASYNERAKSFHIHGVNLFLKEYLKSN
jgi:hypothetical protein